LQARELVLVVTLVGEILGLETLGILLRICIWSEEVFPLEVPSYAVTEQVTHWFLTKLLAFNVALVPTTVVEPVCELPTFHW
jgi:hypothetical protein